MDAPNCPDGCGPLLTPIELMGRQDVAQFQIQHHGHNTWCPCCGETFKSSAEDVNAAQEAWDEYEAEQ